MNKEIYNSIFQEEIHDLIELKRALGESNMMRLSIPMKNFKVFLMQLTKASLCRIPARIVLM